MITDNEFHSNYKHGGLDNLVTADKSSIVAAINSLTSKNATQLNNYSIMESVDMCLSTTHHL